MSATAILPGQSSTVSAAITNTGSSAASDKSTLASNFSAFLQLLTTQLQNQSPLDPLDTNQFTQQLVQFAQVEQMLKSNDQLEALVNLQKTAQQSQALNFVGTTVLVDGSTGTLSNGAARWSFSVSKPASATFTITNATGQTVYSANSTLQPGQQAFAWDGRGANGAQWPDGAYTLRVTATDASGQSVAVATEVAGVVDSVDLTKSPPMLLINGREFALDAVKQVIRRAG